MKTNFRRSLCLLLACLLLPVCFLRVRAEDYWATLRSLHFDITLQEDGSALITETREVMFMGDYEFTRYGVVNGFAGPRVFCDWAVVMDGEPLEMLETPDNDNRPNKTFAVEDAEGENTVYIYHRSNSVSRTFQISYRVENAVKLYDDVGEFHWNLTGENGISNVGLVTANLMIAEGVAEEDFRIWAHGPLNGTFEKLDDVSAYLHVEDVPYDTIVDLRCTIPASFYTDGWIQEGEILPEILAEEKVLADSANAQREEQARQEAEYQAAQDAYWAAREAWEAEHPILAVIERTCQNIIWFIDDVYYYYLEGTEVVWIALLLFGAYFLTRFVYKLLPAYRNMRYKPVHAPQYYRQLPDNRPAPCADRLLNVYKKGGIQVSRHISSALLELNLHKRIRFHVGSHKTEIVLNYQDRVPPVSTPQNAKRVVRLSFDSNGDSQITDSASDAMQADTTYLDTLFRFLQGAAGVTGRITLDGLKDYVKQNQETARNFRNDFQEAVSKDYRKRVHMEQPVKTKLLKNKGLLIAFLVTFLLALLVSTGSYLYDGIYWPACLVFSLFWGGLVLMVGVAAHFGKNATLGSISFLDQKSENDLALWSAFARFLDDFTTFDRKELPEFPVWREYMVYAVAIGKGKKVAQSLAVKYPDAIQTDDDFDDEYDRFLRDMALYEALDSIADEVVTASVPKSHSSGGSDSWSDNWSDSDGGGGGFSDSGGGSDSGSRGDFAD